MNSASFNSNYDSQGNRLAKKVSNNVMTLTMDALALHNDIIETKKQTHDPELEAALRMSEQEAGRRGGQLQKSALHEVLQFKDPNRFQETQFQRENSFQQPPPRAPQPQYHAPAPQYRDYDIQYDEPRYDERDFERYDERPRMFSVDFVDERYDERYDDRGDRRGGADKPAGLPRAKSMHVPASFTNSLNKHISPPQKVHNVFTFMYMCHL